mmetsp:Transcript_5486/g.8193  ORF Transcript_5486/g.8193 Transcript_5486/m.8193 type:complete len:223 (+) Transcript_5486:682-1350(+)
MLILFVTGGVEIDSLPDAACSTSETAGLELNRTSGFCPNLLGSAVLCASAVCLPATEASSRLDLLGSAAATCETWLRGSTAVGAGCIFAAWPLDWRDVVWRGVVGACCPSGGLCALISGEAAGICLLGAYGRDPSDAIITAGSKPSTHAISSGARVDAVAGRVCFARANRVRCIATTNSRKLSCESRSTSARSQICASTSCASPDLANNFCASDGLNRPCSV